VLRAAGALLAVGPPSASLAAAPSTEGPSALYGQGLLVQLRVADLDRSIRFYAEVLGFRMTERRDDLQFAHVECGVPQLQLGLSAGGSVPASPGSVVLNFSVAGDVDAVRAGLEKKGVRFTGPTQVIAGKVRLSPFEDPDGYRLRLAGEDPPRR
jgi:predicted enzyme related to lactoylglutathione lyase